MVSDLSTPSTPSSPSSWFLLRLQTSRDRRKRKNAKNISTNVDGPKRLLSVPYFDNEESASDSDSDSEPDGVVDAIYDIIWITGDAAPAYPYQKTGYTVTIKHVDTYINPFRSIPIRRYKAYLFFLSFRSVYSCHRADYKSYRLFKLLQRNKQMKSGLKVKEAMSFDMSHGALDENGFPFLKWCLNCSEENGIEKGEEGYVSRQGWAKRRVSPDAPSAELSLRERERLHEIDRLDGEYEALLA
ncbi:hypothetical protein BKA65DRAFT_546623 [Rhexocercosporidium sp. MPI-PUGE-AT-0058]|nr:hypothetical protein BKA65DRAFT_546623 [Rhexocercosporidium sp. MPI-PUGE-AT-0058]